MAENSTKTQLTKKARSPVTTEAEPPVSYTLSPATEATLQGIADDLKVEPDLLVEIAVAQWCRFRGAEPGT